MPDIDVRVAPIGAAVDGGHVIALQGSPAVPVRVPVTELDGGGVDGPVSSPDGAPALWDGTGGDTLKAGTAAQLVPAAATDGQVLTLVGGLRAWADPTGGGGGATNLSWTAATRVLASDTGTDATITLATTTDAGLMSSADKTKTDGVEALADVTDAANVNTAGAVMEIDYTAQSVLRATTNGVPSPLTVGEQTLVGRITSGNIAALTPTQIRTLINVQDGATAELAGVLTAADLVEPAGSIAQKADSSTGAIVFAEAINSDPTVAEIIEGDTDGIVDGSVLFDINKPRFVTPAAGVVTIDALAGLNVWVIEGADNLTFVDDSWDNLPIHQVMMVTVIADADARTITFANPLVNLYIPGANAAPWNQTTCFKRFFFSWSPNTSDVTLRDKRIVEFGGYLVPA